MERDPDPCQEHKFEELVAPVLKQIEEGKARDQRRAQREILIRLLCFVLGATLTFLVLR